MFKQRFFSISELRSNTRKIDQAISKKEDAIILDHNKPKFALINFEEYQKMVAEKQEDNEDLKDILKAIVEAKEAPVSLKEFKKRFSNWK